MKIPTPEEIYVLKKRMNVYYIAKMYGIKPSQVTNILANGKPTTPRHITDLIRDLVRKRDNNICQICGKENHRMDGYGMDVTYRDLKKKMRDRRYFMHKDIPDLMTVCRSCNVRKAYNTMPKQRFWLRTKNTFRRLRDRFS